MAHVRADEVVESALRASDEGMPDAENAALHGVAIKTIRRWAWSSHPTARERIRDVLRDRPDLPLVRLRNTSEVGRWLGRLSNRQF